jgi:hypothetical protein
VIRRGECVRFKAQSARLLATSGSPEFGRSSAMLRRSRPFLSERGVSRTIMPSCLSGVVAFGQSRSRRAPPPCCCFCSKSAAKSAVGVQVRVRSSARPGFPFSPLLCAASFDTCAAPAEHFGERGPAKKSMMRLWLFCRCPTGNTGVPDPAKRGSPGRKRYRWALGDRGCVEFGRSPIHPPTARSHR